jgi:frataxin-like iron-binding protein CyaY
MNKEIWKDIKGFEGYYKISNLGNVKSLDRFISNGKGLFLKKGQQISKCINNYGYLRVGLQKNGKQKHYTVHTLVASEFLGYVINGKNDIVVDHKNNIKTDNRLDNLQLLTNRQNISKSKRGSSKYTGVHWHSTNKKWNSNIYIEGKRIFLGSFDSEIEAHKEYIKALNNYKNGK